MSNTAVTKITPEQAKVGLYIMGGLLVLVLVIIVASKLFGGIDLLLQALGLGKSKKEKETEGAIDDAMEEASNTDSAWNPNMYKSAPAGSKLLTPEKTEDVAYKLFSSVGIMWDNEAKGVAAIKMCESKAQVSQVVEYFAEHYDRDTMKWLEDKYDTYEQEQALKVIIDYVKQLPKY